MEMNSSAKPVTGKASTGKNASFVVGARPRIRPTSSGSAMRV